MWCDAGAVCSNYLLVYYGSRILIVHSMEIVLMFLLYRRSHTNQVCIKLEKRLTPNNCMRTSRCQTYPENVRTDSAILQIGYMVLVQESTNNCLMRDVLGNHSLGDGNYQSRVHFGRSGRGSGLYTMGLSVNSLVLTKQSMRVWGALRWS